MTLAGCSKEIESSRINFPEKTVTLTLHGVETKTSLRSDGSVIWSIYDQICVNGQFYPLSVDEDDPSVAYVKGVRESDDYYASYSTVADMTPYHKEGSSLVHKTYYTTLPFISRPSNSIVRVVLQTIRILWFRIARLLNSIFNILLGFYVCP